MNTNRTAEIAKAREVDTEVARLFDLYHEINDQIRIQKKYIADAKKTAKSYYYQSEARQAEIAKRIARYEEKIAELQPEADKRKAAADKFNADNYEGWSRFFHVVHIHSNMHCSSFRPTTRIGWLPNVSGLTEAEAVAEHGATLCTICFPSAPTELTTAKVDETICTGKTFDRSQPHETRRMSKWGTCTECGTRQTLTPTLAVRKHKKPIN